MTGRARRQRRKRQSRWAEEYSYHGDFRGWLLMDGGRATYVLAHRAHRYSGRLK